MTRSFRLSAGAAFTLAVLAACGGGAIGDAAAQFGNNFVTGFRANDRAEPLEPTAISYRGVSDSNDEALATLEPVNF